MVMGRAHFFLYAFFISSSVAFGLTPRASLRVSAGFRGSMGRGKGTKKDLLVLAVYQIRTLPLERIREPNGEWNVMGMDW